MVRNQLSRNIKQIIWAVFSLFMCLQTTNSLASETLNYLVVEDQAEPFQIINDADQNFGIISDLLFKILEKSPYQVQVKSYPFKRMVKNINAGLIPLWITYGSSKWKSPQNLNLSECSILKVKHVLLPPKGETVQLNGIEGLLGQRVILMFGFDYPNLDEYLSAKKILELRVMPYRSAFKALALQRGLGFIEMESRIQYNLKINGEKYSDYHSVDLSSVIPKYDIRCALSPEMPEKIKRYIDDQCDQLKGSGEFKKIINRYLTSTNESSELGSE